MSLGIDPFAASLLFSAGLTPHASRLRTSAESPNMMPSDMPFLSFSGVSSTLKVFNALEESARRPRKAVQRAALPPSPVQD